MSRLSRFIHFYTDEDEGNGGGGDPGILKTVSGALIHIMDALAKPAKNFTATLEPVKVTGKNLFNKNDFVRNEGYINPNTSDYRAGEGRTTAVLPDPIPPGTYTISRATSARLRVGLVTSTTLTSYQVVTNRVSGTNNSDDSVTITVSQSGYYLVIFFKDTSDNDEQYLLDHLQVEVGSSATSYEDYTCTFTGHTGANTYVNGKNLALLSDDTMANHQQETHTYANNGVIVTGTASYGRCGYSIKVKKGVTYTVSLKAKKGESNVFGIYFNDTTNWQYHYYIVGSQYLQTTLTEFNFSFIATSDTLFIGVYAGPGVLTVEDLQVEVGTTKTDFATYSCTTIPITFPSEAGTVYGGTLTNKGTDEWTLVVGKKYMLLNDDTKWTNQTGTIDIGYQTDATDRKIFDNSYDGFICSYAGINRSGSNTARWIGATSTTFGFKGLGLTLEKVKEDALANKISIVYELAEPTEYTLTEAQALTLLKGVNNIWCDASDSLELQYYAKAEETTP